MQSTSNITAKGLEASKHAYTVPAKRFGDVSMQELVADTKRIALSPEYEEKDCKPIKGVVEDHSDVFLPTPTIRETHGSLSDTLALGGVEEFDVMVLAAGLCFCGFEQVQYYLSQFPSDTVFVGITTGVICYEWPVIFYAVKRGCLKTLRLLLEYAPHSLLANAVSCSRKIPLLAYAVFRGSQTARNTLEIVKLLLAAGANPRYLPQDLWINYMERPCESALCPPIDFRGNTRAQTMEGQIFTTWCTPLLRKKLVACLTLSQRYMLWKAHQQLPVRARELQAGRLLKISALRELPYWLIGQNAASSAAVNVIFSHLIHNDPKPLSMIFAGPSGHGKTELAAQMAKLLKLEFLVVDCGQVQTETSLLGSHSGYAGNTRGSQLNNFLAANDGKRSVVFLDELDKSSESVWDALLVVTDSGKYQDRRTNTDVDASRTIFIFCTNEGDRTIRDFYDTHMSLLPDAQKPDVDRSQLLTDLRKDFIAKFGAPLTGRLRHIIPFLPFSKDEAAVIAHGFILQLVDSVRKDISLEEGRLHLVGHAHLHVHRDEEVCRFLAEKAYSPHLGARIIENRVVEMVRLKMDEVWKDSNVEIHAGMNDGPLDRYVVLMVPTEGSEMKVVVKKSGVTEVEEWRIAAT